MTIQELVDLVYKMNQHSRRRTLWQDTAMILNFEELAEDILEDAPHDWPIWDYYTDELAHSLFTRIMDTGLVTYYASPKESFCEIQGMRECAKAGHTFLLLENMS